VGEGPLTALRPVENAKADVPWLTADGLVMENGRC
jgi:hypothetical protein